MVTEMDANPQLKAAAMGDQKIIIVPTKKPPKLKSIEKWLTGRNLYRKAKQVINKAPAVTAVVKKADIPKLEIDEAAKDEIDLAGHTESNRSIPFETSDDSDMICSQSPYSYLAKTSTQIPNQSKDLMFKTPSVPKRSVSDPTPPHHSTPSKKMLKLEAEALSCTPILKTSQAAQLHSQPGTSKSRLSKRASSGSESLRKVLLNSQMKVIFLSIRSCSSQFLYFSFLLLGPYENQVLFRGALKSLSGTKWRHSF